MEVATIKGATHNPGAPRNWTEANGPCGALPIIYRTATFRFRYMYQRSNVVVRRHETRDRNYFHTGNN